MPTKPLHAEHDAKAEVFRLINPSQVLLLKNAGYVMQKRYARL